MVYTAAYRQGWLSYVYRKKHPNDSLLDAIQDQLDLRFPEASTGKSISSVSGNGHAVTFEAGNSVSGAATDKLAFVGEMERLHDLSKQSLVNAGIANPSDAQVFAEMKHRIGDGVYEVEPSQFAELRNP